MSTHTTVCQRPGCDLCHRAASYDARTHAGPWAWLCVSCFAAHGVGLGPGRGQRLRIDPAGRGVRRDR